MNKENNKYLVLVNADHPYEGAGREKLVKFPGTEISMEQEAAEQLTALLNTLPGDQIVLVSGYRTRREQEEIWDNSVRENGLEFTKKYVAKPGCSEHETGLAIDLGLKAEEIDFIRPAFPYEGICQKFREKAADYGFIERYQRSKEMVTGISAEQWHFRYVGVPHAGIIKEKDLALEEYIAYLERAAKESGCSNGGTTKREERLS